MQLRYRPYSELKSVDISKLRPAGAYKALMDKRSYPVDKLIEKYGKIPNEMLEDRNCPICSSGSGKLEMQKDGHDIKRCGECDIVYVSPVFSSSHYLEIYDEDETRELSKIYSNQSHEYRLARFGRERVERMSQFIPSEIQVPVYLDVGCSTGFTVEAAQEAGWNATGIDLNSSCIEFGQNRGLNLICEDLFASDFKDGTFDAISLFDVLEHLIDPVKVLNKVWELLKPNGVVYIYVPNYDSASRILMGKEAHFIWPTHHLTYFNIPTLTDALERNDFEPLFLETEGLDLYDYSWKKENEGEGIQFDEDLLETLQFFINAGYYGKNLRCLARKI